MSVLKYSLVASILISVLMISLLSLDMIKPSFLVQLPVWISILISVVIISKRPRKPPTTNTTYQIWSDLSSIS